MGKRGKGFCCKEQEDEDLEIERGNIAVTGNRSHCCTSFGGFRGRKGDIKGDIQGAS